MVAVLSDPCAMKGDRRTTEHTEDTEEAAMSQPELVHEELTGVLRQTAFETHAYFGNGFLEKVYEKALVNRLRKKGIKVAQQCALFVRDEDGTIVGEYVADLVVRDCVVVEVKAVASLVDEHIAQMLNYLKASGIRLGVLVNFGARRLQFRRFLLDQRPSVSSVCSVVSPG